MLIWVILTPERSLTHSPNPKTSNRSTNNSKSTEHTSSISNWLGSWWRRYSSRAIKVWIISHLRFSSKFDAGKEIWNTHPFKPLLDPFGFWVDVERNLRSNGSTEWSQFHRLDQKWTKFDTFLPHLKRVMFDYEIDRIINGLRWLIYEWKLASIATAIKYLLIDDIWTMLKTQSNRLWLRTLLECSRSVLFNYKTDFRNRIRIIMALIDGWNFEHVRELFNFLCTASCISTSQSAFLLQALLLAFLRLHITKGNWKGNW